MSDSVADMKWFRDNRFGLAQRTMLLLVAVVSGSLAVLAAQMAVDGETRAEKAG